MQDARTHQSVSSRLDVEFPERPDPWRRRRARWCWIAALLPCCLLAWWAARRDQVPLQARPVSTAHQLFANDCQQCHVVPFQSISRLVASKEHLRQIETDACRKCHAQQTDDHHGAMAEMSHSCFDCHREHLSAPELARTKDAHCTACHGDLNAAGKSSFASFTSFAEHPEFAVLRPAAQLPLNHEMRSYLKSMAGSVGASPTDALADGTPLHFSHRAHFPDGGVRLHRDHAEYRDDQRTKTLVCADCHVVDATGSYMRPITYAAHCAQCHPLSFSSQLVSGGPLPHGDVNAAYGVIRERLLNHYRKHIANSSARTDEESSSAATNTSRLPNLSTGAESPSRDEFEWAQERMSDVQIETHGPGVAVPTVVRKGCEYCHMTSPSSVTSANSDLRSEPNRELISGRSTESTSPPANEAGSFSVEVDRLVPWRIQRGTPDMAQPLIPERWMPHSRFRHDRHDSDLLRCETCHAESRASTTTSDILMPSIQVCRTCHGNAPQHNGLGARYDCAECHTYHHSVSVGVITGSTGTE